MGDGTQENPFTIEDVYTINGALTGKQWVIGYIVGCAGNGGIIGDNAASNIALGDAANQTTNLVPVQLVNNSSPRAALNIVDNPGNIGKQVKVHGDLQSYFSAPGVKNTDDYEIIVIPTYAVTFAAPANGTLDIYEDDLETLISSGDEFVEGTELYVDAKPASGYKLNAVKVIKTGVEPEEDVTDAVYDEGLLTIPAYAITVSATFSVATALEDVETSVKAVKVLRDGQIFILRGDKTFNAQGQLVK